MQTRRLARLRLRLALAGIHQSRCFSANGNGRERPAVSQETISVRTPAKAKDKARGKKTPRRKPLGANFFCRSQKCVRKNALVITEEIGQKEACSFCAVLLSRLAGRRTSEVPGGLALGVRFRSGLFAPEALKEILRFLADREVQHGGINEAYRERRTAV